MSRRKFMGVFIFVSCIAAFFVYAYLLMLSEWSPIVLQLTILMVVGGVLGIVSWIGYQMATTSAKPSSLIEDD
ncbi:transcriptional regulator [Candidatus Nitrosopelagicus sp.]|nr:transcriptional regulator [Candidatus Nitrosopelagicus sp.]